MELFHAPPGAPAFVCLSPSFRVDADYNRRERATGGGPVIKVKTYNYRRHGRGGG